MKLGFPGIFPCNFSEENKTQYVQSINQLSGCLISISADSKAHNPVC